MEYPKENFKVDDLVLLADEHYPRGQWPLARVVEVFKGEDGYVRSAKVMTSSTVVTRAKRQTSKKRNQSDKNCSHATNHQVMSS